MTEAFVAHIQSTLHFLKESKVLVACSGGVDSVALTHLLHDMGIELTLAHCNFNLRGDESDEDERFVIKLANELNLPLEVVGFNTKEHADLGKISIQMAARELRYTWFTTLMKKKGYDYVVTGHHKDDNLETFLINLGRGTGVSGLRGISANNGKIVRPLLPFTRAEIEKFALERGISWREDSSNSTSDYLRNALRHQVVPPLKKFFPGFLTGFTTTLKNLDDNERLLNDYVGLVRDRVLVQEDNIYVIDIAALQEFPNTDALLYELLSPFGFTAWEDIVKLLNAQAGKRIYSEEFTLWKDRETLLISQRDSNNEKPIGEVLTIEEDVQSVLEPLALQFADVDQMGELSSNIAYLDKDLLHFPLKLRPWENGDSFRPFGMQGKKKLSKFFKDEKLSLIAKEKIWVLCSEENIVWVVGMRMSNDYKVTDNTTRIYRVIRNV